MALAVGDANSAAEFVSPTSEEVGHPARDKPSRYRKGAVASHDVGWPMALALGDANSAAEFVSPTPEEVGHPARDELSRDRKGAVASRDGSAAGNRSLIRARRDGSDKNTLQF